MKKEQTTEKKQEIISFIQKMEDYYGKNECRKKLYELFSKRPEIISNEFFEMIEPLSSSQIYEVINGFEKGLDIETIKIYAKPEFDSSQMMHKILEGILSGVELDKIRLYAKEEFKGWIGNLNLIAKKLDFETIKKYLNLDLSAKTRENILRILKDNPNITEERVEVLCNNCWNDEQFYHLFCYVQDYFQKITLKQLKIIANPKFDENQIQEVARGYINGLKDRSVAIYAQPEIPFWIMNYIRLGFEKGISLRKIYYYSGIGKKYGLNAIKEVYECFLQGLSIEEVKVIVDVSNENYKNSSIGSNIKLAREIVKYGCSLQDLQEISNKSLISREMTFENVLKGLKDNISIENIKYYAKLYIYYSSEINEIILGFKHGLIQEQVKIYAKTKFTANIMRIIRLCLEYGMSIQEAETLSENKQFTDMEAFIKHKKIKKTADEDLYTLISKYMN